MALPRAKISGYSFEAIEIHDEILWEPGGDVYEWLHEVARELQTVTKRTAPSTVSKSRWGHRGTGRLKAGITANVEMDRLKVANIILNSSAPYTMYVHGGTAYRSGSFIYSNLGWANKITVDALYERKEAYFRNAGAMRGLFMALPPGPGGTWRYHMRVRGQKANAFLSRGYNRVAELGHPALPKLGIELFPDARVIGER